MPTQQTGTVKLFNSAKGYGVITPDDGGVDLYVQPAGILETPPMFLGGESVSFVVVQGKKGPEAQQVLLI
jgi:CspA family cold shock protein